MYGDEYQEIITNFNHHFTIQYIKMKKNSGPGPCRNIVIQQGVGDWITFIDDDDIFCANPLKNIHQCDMLRSIVYDNEGHYSVSEKTVFGCVFGILFNREFLNKTNLLFSFDLGIVGTEDSVFLLISSSCAEQVIQIPSFILHY